VVRWVLLAQLEELEQALAAKVVLVVLAALLKLKVEMGIKD
tara:strand:+ start:508 stop:630 length:123 start_codon:yes stop_codon:yes gene_type:complete